ncbi:MAG: helix-hairpin-helix domain-containing protein [Cytophagales bacterium]|nr:helix-hairpin-helix domain-containing protein [Cytophagales bacterium]
MRLSAAVCLFFLVQMSHCVLGQPFPRPELEQQQLIERLFAQQTEDTDYEELYEALMLHYNQPLDINKAGPEDLRSLFILTDAQVEALLSYRERYGNLLSLYELQAVPGFDLPTIYDLAPFVTISYGRASAKPFGYRLLRESTNYLIIRNGRTLQAREGYLRSPEQGSHYSGDPNQLYGRLRMSRPKDFSFGLTFEKMRVNASIGRPIKTHTDLIFTRRTPCWSGAVDSKNSGRRLPNAVWPKPSARSGVYRGQRLRNGANCAAQ